MAESRSLRALRPVAMLAVAGALLIAGVVVAFLRQPKADAQAPLEAAQRLIDRSMYAEAAELLNERMVPLIESGLAGPAQQREMYRLRAHALFMGQQAKGQNLAANHKLVVDDYKRLEESGGKLSGKDAFELGSALLATGALEEAASRAKSIPETDRPLRRQLVRAIVEQDLARGDQAPALALGLLNDILAEPDLDETERAWAVARQTELQLTDGHAGEAVDRLLREIQRAVDAPKAQRAELHALLGRAYVQLENQPLAQKQFEQAEALLGPGDMRRAEIELALGELLLKQHSHEEAQDRFTSVLSDFGAARSALPARFGLAQARAALGKHEAALELADGVIAEVSRGEPRRDCSSARVKDWLLSTCSDLSDRDDFETAIKYATLAQGLYPGGHAPPEVLRAIGSAMKRRALQRLAEERKGRQDLEWQKDLSPVAREEIKRLLLGAGKYLREHARAVTDASEYAASLWEAADAFDLGGDAESARKAFNDYADGATDIDPHRAEARWRLAQVLQSMSQYTSAADLYRGLLDGAPTVPAPTDVGGPGTAAGPWAVRSIVPLAECLLHDGDPSNDGEAERLLLRSVDGSTLGPEAEEFRHGLIALGRLLYEQGRYEDAIARLSESIERFPTDRGLDSLRFALADSYRLSASKIDASLQAASSLPASERAERDAARTERLRKAIDTFEQVRRSLEAKDPERLSDLEKVQLRNTMFYLGDCAYDLGDYAAAIGAYDAARQRYPGEPASLVAMVQIVNAYVAQGEWAKARTANDSARRQLAKLPQTVWDSPDMPMERKHWERWLNSTTLLEQHAQVDPK